MQFSFPFRDIWCFCPIRLQNVSRLEVMFTGMDSLWEAACTPLIARYQPRECHHAQSCGQRSFIAWWSQSEDHGRISQIRERNISIFLNSYHVCGFTHHGDNLFVYSQPPALLYATQISFEKATLHICSHEVEVGGIAFVDGSRLLLNESISFLWLQWLIRVWACE